MDTIKSWEFDCPQFVDFENGASSPKDDVFFGGTSPGLRSTEPKLVNSPIKFARPRPVPLLTVHTEKKSCGRYVHSANTTDSEKVVQNQLSKRLSKSDGSIHVTMKSIKIPANEQSGYFAQLKRTLSESGFRLKAKTGPTTPLCLKRTLCKTKNKKIKTTEELELEKIAQLQMQTKLHLRANELTMMRRRQKPCAMQREVTKTDLKCKDVQVQVCPPKEQKVILKVNVPRKIRSPQGPKIDEKTILTREIERMKALNPFQMGQQSHQPPRLFKPLRETNHWNKINPKYIWPGKDGINSLGEKKYKNGFLEK